MSIPLKWISSFSKREHAWCPGLDLRGKEKAQLKSLLEMQFVNRTSGLLLAFELAWECSAQLSGWYWKQGEISPEASWARVAGGVLMWSLVSERALRATGRDGGGLDRHLMLSFAFSLTLMLLAWAMRVFKLSLHSKVDYINFCGCFREEIQTRLWNPMMLYLPWNFITF